MVSGGFIEEVSPHLRSEVSSWDDARRAVLRRELFSAVLHFPGLGSILDYTGTFRVQAEVSRDLRRCVATRRRVVLQDLFSKEFDFSTLGEWANRRRQMYWSRGMHGI